MIEIFDPWQSTQIQYSHLRRYWWWKKKRKQKTNIQTNKKTENVLDGTSLKLVDKFTYLGSSVSSTEKDIDTRLTKAWTAIDRLLIIWKSDLTDKMKRSFFQAAVISILLYGCTTWTLTKQLKKKLDGNYTRMLSAILNRSWRQHPTRHQLYGHLPPIMKTIQVRRTRHTGHCWRSKDKLISDVPLWTPAYGQAKAGRPARTYIQQLCEDTGCSPEDLPKAMNDKEKWRERVTDIRASGTTWWWFIYENVQIYKKKTRSLEEDFVYRSNYLPTLNISIFKGENTIIKLHRFERECLKISHFFISFYNSYILMKVYCFPI